MTIHTAIKIPLTMPVHPVVVRYTEPGGAVTYEVMERSAVGNDKSMCMGEILEAAGDPWGKIYAFSN